jgi:flavorubredoxin
MNTSMTDMKFDVIDDGLRVKYVPEDTDFDHCIELGRKVGRAIKAKQSE